MPDRAVRDPRGTITATVVAAVVAVVAFLAGAREIGTVAALAAVVLALVSLSMWRAHARRD